MSDRFIPYGAQSIDDDDVRAVTDALRDPYLTTGPRVARFEHELARLSDRRHAVVVNSGTAALHAAYFAAGIGPGSSIVTSPLTFAATANAALYLGADVHFADVTEDTGNLDPEQAAGALQADTRAIVAVDFAGHPADFDALRVVAEGAGAPLLADAAHSLGATAGGRPAAAAVDAAIYSFHPVKLITTAEGGAVVTDDEAWAARARRFRDHGIERAAERLVDVHGPWSQEMQALGFNYRLPDLNCALGCAQLTRLDRFLQRRRWIAARYRESLADVAGLRLPEERPGVCSAWHLYVVRVRGDPARRRPFFERLRKLHLGVQVHYLPVYLHPYYRRLGYAPGLCPRAEDFYARAVSIPIYPGMTDDDVDLVIERVRSAARDTL